VPIRALLICVLVGVLAACGGSDEPAAETVVLDNTSFKEVVEAELRKADLEAEKAFGQRMEVSVTEEPNRVDVVLDEAFAEYQDDPGRRDEILAEIVADTRRRLETGISETSFADAESELMPVLKPRFEIRQFVEEPAATSFPAALSIVYAVDAENQFTVVTQPDLRRWGKSLAEIHEVALDNLLQRTNREEKLLCEPSAGSELCGWASGDGYDATRMVVPELRRQIERVYDGDPALYAVPTEGVFVALPLALAKREGTQQALRAKVERDFATAKENPLSPELFVERNGKLVIF
jgi:uncharacterized protein YtpQ (UPF0354 family)